MKHSIRFLLFSFSIFYLPSGLLANSSRVEVAPFFGLRFGGDLHNNLTGEAIPVDSSVSTGLTLGFKLPPPHDFLELHYSHQDSDFSGGGSSQEIGIKIDEIQAGILREMGGSDRFRPFLVGLLGASHFQFSTGAADDTLFGFGMGGGFKYFPLPHIGFRMDLRAYGSVVSGSSTIACSGGCIISFKGDIFWQGELAPSLIIRF